LIRVTVPSQCRHFIRPAKIDRMGALAFLPRGSVVLSRALTRLEQFTVDCCREAAFDGLFRRAFLAPLAIDLF